MKESKDDNIDEDFDFLWLLSSKLRRNILLELSKEKSKMNVIAKKLETALSQTLSNFDLLKKAQLIKKDSDGYYHLTMLGKISCEQIQSIDLLANTKKYLNNHDFENLPQLFKQSLGLLLKGQYIYGSNKVKNQWNRIHANAEKYIKNILIDVPYDDEIIKLISQKAKSDVKSYSIFSKNAIIMEEERKQALTKYKFEKYFKENKIQRKTNKDVKVSLCLNEKEAIVKFSNNDGEEDSSKAFYSINSDFCSWCEALFEYYWKRSSSFRENFWI